MADGKRIVTIGGGTGHFTVLSGLKEYPHHLSAIVSMADDGGSTGVLRTELGVLPPGDVRQCLVALSRSSDLLRELFTYRFEGGRFEGANVGNLFLSALEKITGDFDAAVQRMGEILRIRGQVIPVTTDNVTLTARFSNGGVLRGQETIQASDISPETLFALDPLPKANPRAIKAISEADLLVFGPGDLYTSILPNLLVVGIPEALRASKARKIYVANLVNKPNHTSGFHVADYVRVLERYLGGPFFDTILYNTASPPPHMIERYAHAGETPIRCDDEGFRTAPYAVVGAPLLHDQITIVQNPHDSVPRSLIRHDTAKLAQTLLTRCLS